MSGASDSRLELTPTQQRLLEALIDHQPHLGEWYLAAIAIINDTSLPDRLALVAHSLREVMEKLPGDGIRVDRGADLPTKVRNLRPSWDAANEDNKRCGGAWYGEIADSLREFLVVMQSFFDGQDQLVRSRRESAQQFMNSLYSTSGLPEDVQRENAKRWMDLRGYFVNVAHHGSVEEGEFRERVAAFEVFVAARLKPRPTDDFAAIDALLEED